MNGNAESGFYFPPYLTMAHLFHAPAGWSILDRKLNEFALQYVVEGYAEYEIEGRAYPTREGDLIIHRPQELHSIRTFEGRPYVCISLVFHFGGAPFPLERSLQGGHACGNYLGKPADKLLSELVVQYRKAAPEGLLRCQALFLQILAEIEARLSSDRQDAPLMKKRNRMILIKNHIIDNYAPELNFKQLEQISGMSKNYLISTFTQTFGIPPAQYQLMVRVQRAKEMAIHSGLSVGEIANRVGYQDVHSFGKMFKKKTGSSLSEFCSALAIRPLVYPGARARPAGDDGC